MAFVFPAPRDAAYPASLDYVKQPARTPPHSMQSHTYVASRPTTWTQHAPPAHDPSAARSELGPASPPSSRTTTSEGSDRLGARRRARRHPRQPGAGVLEGFRRARDRTLFANWSPRPGSEALLRAVLGAAIPTRVRPHRAGRPDGRARLRHPARGLG